MREGKSGGDAAERVEDNILSSARYFKREAAVNAENANLGSIYSSERKEREAVNKMSVSFAREEVRDEVDAEEVAGEDEIQYSKRIAETITKSTVIEERNNIDSEEDEIGTEGFSKSKPKEGRLRWDAIEGKWMSKSALDDWDANIQSYMDSRRTQKTKEDEWIRRKHKKIKELFNIELKAPYLKSARGRSGDMEVAYCKTEVNSYCNTMRNTDENDIWKKSKNSYERTRQNSYYDSKRKNVEKNVMKNKRVESKNERLNLEDGRLLEVILHFV